MADSGYSLAAVLATVDPERLYSGLSLLVAAVTDGERAAALASFAGLGLLMDDELPRRTGSAEVTPSLTWAGRETFGRSLAELIDAARELENLKLWACSASAETMGIEAAAVEERLDGVLSTPRFLRETSGARLLFV